MLYVEHIAEGKKNKTLTRYMLSQSFIYIQHKYCTNTTGLASEKLIRWSLKCLFAASGSYGLCGTLSESAPVCRRLWWVAVRFSGASSLIWSVAHRSVSSWLWKDGSMSSVPLQSAVDTISTISTGQWQHTPEHVTEKLSFFSVDSWTSQCCCKSCNVRLDVREVPSYRLIERLSTSYRQLESNISNMSTL